MTAARTTSWRVRPTPGGYSIGRVAALGFLALALVGCSIKRTAVDWLGSSLGEGAGTYARDGDPDLVRAALPFALKTQEGLLEISPENRGLLLASARGFAAYAYILKQDTDRLNGADAEAARALYDRAHKLFLRGRDYALRGLDAAHPGFTTLLREDPPAALGKTVAVDVPLLYYAGASWAGALSVRKDDLDLIAELPLAAALVERVLFLDERYEEGAAHEFFIAYEGGRPGGDAGKARMHYLRAVELSGGGKASVHLALAESVLLAEQDLEGFQWLLDRAEATDLEAAPQQRLVNVLALRRARWLRQRLPDLFLNYEAGTSASRPGST